MRVMLAADFRAQVLLHEGSAHSFGGLVQKVTFCTASNGLLFLFVVAMFICGVPFISKQAMEGECLPSQIGNS